MKKTAVLLLTIFSLSACIAAGTEEPVQSSSAKPAPPLEKTVMGWVENVYVGDISQKVKAKLDSGATTSSVNAEIVKTFRKDGKRHVIFRVDFDDHQETFEAPVKRWVRIKTKDGDLVRRPVVEMKICIGKKRVTAEVNLAERGHFIYPVLIGRNVLKDKILVDSAKTFTDNPSCKPPPS